MKVMIYTSSPIFIQIHSSSCEDFIQIAFFFCQKRYFSSKLLHTLYFFSADVKKFCWPCSQKPTDKYSQVLYAGVKEANLSALDFSWLYRNGIFNKNLKSRMKV